MHWGLYAVPSYCPVTAAQKTCYAEHFWDTSIDNSTGQHAYMQRVYGKDFKYQDFAPMFTCSDFNPQQWAALFKASGARGLTMTSKHHEGWTLWPTPRHANCAQRASYEVLFSHPSRLPRPETTLNYSSCNYNSSSL